ncbi:PocR ligand-binding domain-containing protein [Acetobacterium tundrae]|uniref:Diguanylate cyclase n=1 Tax=Acetobacterium tundrae TaxID=132932 RepID=A0ABR6WLQ5_9FIRM|nr:PocR ligand-binding domain-containing protein [Acetobacterium tundrae]MBC3797369.1 diguanylate cyclase [Acetobacterium tundrae]
MNSEDDKRTASETTVSNKLTAMIGTKIDFDEIALADIVDAPALRSLMENFQRITGMSGTIIDNNGKVLVSVGWQDICTKFHRCHPETRKNCVESDMSLARDIESGTFQSYRCKNGMWDLSSPIVVSGHHMGSIHFGQFIYTDEEPDVAYFRNQARRYGFDETEYLDALNRVPRYERETVAEVMSYYAQLGAMISALSFSNLSLSRMLTERKRAEAALKESEKKFQLLFTRAPMGYQSLDFDGNFIEVNPKWLETLGYQREEVIGKWFGDFLCSEYVEGFRVRFPLFKSQGYIHSEFEMRHKNGQRLVIAFEGKIGYNGDGTFKQTHCILQDITERKAVEDQLYNEKELFKTTLISIGDGVISTDTQGLVLIMNKVAEQLTGWSQAEAFGQPIEAVFQIVNEFTRARCNTPVAKVLAIEETIELVNHTLLISKDGIERPIEDSAAPIIDARGNLSGVVLVFRDFTEKKKKDDAIKYLSFHDHLTGLYNRRFYEEELTRLDTRRRWPLTVVMGDVNGLKLINDSFGHENGDQLLIKTAKAITNGCRADDIIARVGGDEFVILLPETDSYEAAKMIKRIKNLLIKESIEGIKISVSFGSETKISADDDIKEVIRKAEDTMYHNKLFEGPSLKGQVIDNIIDALNRKSKREEVHARNVSSLCERMGMALDLEEYKIKELKAFGLLHDIGKIAISDKILNKRDRFTADEWIEMKGHAEIGYRILSTNNDLIEIAEYVLAHHERWDGKGYPKGLKGRESPFQARICAIADAYDAMISERSYKSSLPVEVAIAELRNNAGTQFDAELVRVFIDQL